VDRRQRQTLVTILVAVAILLVICCVAVIIGWSWLRRTVVPTPDNTVQVTVLYSPEKAAWFEPRVSEFNSLAVRIGGRRVEVVAEAMDSGEALEAILDGSRTPTVWSPASTLWVPLLNERWQAKTGVEDPLAIYPEPLVVSPLVIAMWQDQAQAMGYPGRPIGWQEIISATLDPRGWGLYGHPEWGAFKLGHTNPYFSNSGLLSVAAEGYAAAGKVRDLTPEDLAQPGTRAYVQKIERAIIHYGESSEYFAQQMAQRGPSYASAVVLEEQTVVRLNRGAYGNLPQPLVAIYPKEGTFWSDHPYVILRGDWVSAEAQSAALAFRDYLLSRDVQEKALAEGFRPADTSIPLANSILGPAVGVDPFQPQTVLEVPSADTLEALLSAWRDVRKKVNVLLVVDISGSMDEADKLPAVQDGLKLFLSQLGDEDVAGVLVFNDQISTLSPLTPLGPKRQQLDSAIDGLQAGYNTVLYDVTSEAVNQMQAAYDPERINAIVLMTDGQDTASWSSESTMMSNLEAAAASDRPVRVFTIAYGSDADEQLLDRMAQATAGRMVKGTPENIRRLYVILSSYF
jgi:Ca-activated chloride channel family protein